MPLWKDITAKTRKREELPQNKKPKQHFTGAIVIQQKSTLVGGLSAYEIIDGQQRLTTFQIALCAFRDVCREKRGDEFAALAEEAVTLLINVGMRAKKGDGSGKYKLMPTQFDQSAMKFLVDHSGETIGENAPKSRLIDAYNFFHAQIKQFVGNDESKAELLLTSIREDFGFVEILIDGEDEPEIIFESLNARGKRLEQFDLLRNYLFLRTRQSEGEDRDNLYQNYWAHFETPPWDKPVKAGRQLMPLSELFLQHFLMAKLATEKVSPLFQTYRGEYEGISSRDALETLHRYSWEYLQLAIGNDDSPVARNMQTYRQLDTTSLRPFFLYLLADVGVRGKRRDHIFHALESYAIRRVLGTTHGSRDFNKFFPWLIRQLRKEGFSERTLFTLLLRREDAPEQKLFPLPEEPQKSSARQWVSDLRVREALSGKWKVIGVHPNVIRYILYRIECRLQEKNSRAEDITLNPHNLTLEHILPQNWKQTWTLPTAKGAVTARELYTREYKKEHPFAGEHEFPQEGLADESYESARAIAAERHQLLQSIGNLTLLTGALNSSSKDAPFHRKKQKMEENSLLLLSKEVCREDDWDVAQIQRREARLYNLFCELWPNAQWFLDNIPSE